MKNLPSHLVDGKRKTEVGDLVKAPGYKGSPHGCLFGVVTEVEWSESATPQTDVVIVRVYNDPFPGSGLTAQFRYSELEIIAWPL